MTHFVTATATFFSTFPRGLLFVWVFAPSLLAFEFPRAHAAESLRVLSLNSHAYHPMQEARRFFQSRDLSVQAAESYLTYFTMGEIERGHERQLTLLSDALAKIDADVLLLQEVVAGLPGSGKNCDEFYRDERSDYFGKNSALRLRNRLNGRGLNYDSALACRGNIGWQTDHNTFRNRRILRALPNGSGNSRYEVVHEFDSNPYPNGMVVEGTAILVKAPWHIRESREWRLPIPGTNETFFFQTARIGVDGNDRWALVANLHGGHKVRHFEQALAVREALSAYVMNHPDQRNFAGLIVGGDMNSMLYRPRSYSGEISALPWEINVEGEFAYGPKTPRTQFEVLKAELKRLNLDPSYKPWASIDDPTQAHLRIESVVDRFAQFVLKPLSEIFTLREMITVAQRDRRCTPPPGVKHLDPSCVVPSRIDHIFASDDWDLKNGLILFSKNNWVSLEGVSDHPAVIVDLQMKK